MFKYIHVCSCMFKAFQSCSSCLGLCEESAIAPAENKGYLFCGAFQQNSGCFHGTRLGSPCLWPAVRAAIAGRPFQALIVFLCFRLFSSTLHYFVLHTSVLWYKKTQLHWFVYFKIIQARPSHQAALTLGMVQKLPGSADIALPGGAETWSFGPYRADFATVQSCAVHFWHASHGERGVELLLVPAGEQKQEACLCAVKASKLSIMKTLQRPRRFRTHRLPQCRTHPGLYHALCGLLDQGSAGTCIRKSWFGQPELWKATYKTRVFITFTYCTRFTAASQHLNYCLSRHTWYAKPTGKAVANSFQISSQAALLDKLGVSWKKNYAVSCGMSRYVHINVLHAPLPWSKQPCKLCEHTSIMHPFSIQFCEHFRNQ